MKDYYTPKDLEGKGVASAITIRRWCSSGELKHYKFGRGVRIKVSDWESYCKENEL